MSCLTDKELSWAGLSAGSLREPVTSMAQIQSQGCVSTCICVCRGVYYCPLPPSKDSNKHHPIKRRRG